MASATIGRTRSAAISIAALAMLVFAKPRTAEAQTRFAGFDLDLFQPSVPVDAFFGVPSPAVGGHLVPRFGATFDYANRPFHVTSGGTSRDIVSNQGYLRLDASLALWDRLLVSVEAPFAVAQSGSDPRVGVDFHPPNSAAFGDMRLGLRVRLAGSFRDPFQFSLGSYVFLPTGSPDAYTGEGRARGVFHALVGGRSGGSSMGFVWSATGGVMLRADEDPLGTFGAGAGIVFGEDRLQIGPELFGSSQIGGNTRSATTSSGQTLRAASQTELEILGGAKVRLAGGLHVGVAIGGGPPAAIGSPDVRFVSTATWTPFPKDTTVATPTVTDRDGDEIPDDVDACPDVKGERQSDPTKDGCPVADRDHDGVLDVDDACPNEPGAKNPDPTKNGCPPDADGDGIPDAVDACPTVPGVHSADRLKNGCPADRDGDGIPDSEDACPDRPGPRTSDKFSGCPEDADGDGIKNAIDACPFEKGPTDPDPKRNGCPHDVRFSDSELLLSTQIEFIPNGKDRNQTVAPISEGLLREIKDLIDSHREVAKIEVQGHTDDDGTEEYNLQLSQARAEAVRNWLINAGVPADKLVAKGYGFWRPKSDNRIKLGRKQNRRVEFVILERRK